MAGSPTFLVSINPESKSRATNREVLSELINLHGKTSLSGKLPAYDGRKSLYTVGSLPFGSEEFVVKLIDPEKKEKERAEREYKIAIRIAGRTDLYHLQQFLLGRQRDMPQETIQVLDVVLRESPSWNYVTVSRSFFSTQFGHQGDIGDEFECWRGYYQNLSPTQMGLSLNIDISSTSFLKPVTIPQFVEEFLNICDTSRPLSDRDCVKNLPIEGTQLSREHDRVVGPRSVSDKFCTFGDKLSVASASTGQRKGLKRAKNYIPQHCADIPHSAPTIQAQGHISLRLVSLPWIFEFGAHCLQLCFDVAWFYLYSYDYLNLSCPFLIF
uniref:Argonaute linker 1 domain-containing protein n=1 Tax=Leersia perrieri TaxID=77586 RepID=A0A0D9VX05_9ORYZ